MNAARLEVCAEIAKRNGIPFARVGPVVYVNGTACVNLLQIVEVLTSTIHAHCTINIL